MSEMDQVNCWVSLKIRNPKNKITTSGLFICGKNLIPSGVHSTADLKDFADSTATAYTVNLFDVGPTCLPYGAPLISSYFYLAL